MEAVLQHVPLSLKKPPITSTTDDARNNAAVLDGPSSSPEENVPGLSRIPGALGDLSLWN